MLLSPVDLGDPVIGSVGGNPTVVRMVIEPAIRDAGSDRVAWFWDGGAGVGDRPTALDRSPGR